MSLDLHLARDKQEATYKQASASLDWHEHGLLFGNGKLLSDSYPLLSRMRDYYADTQFEGDELEGLIQEIEVVIQGCAGNPGRVLALQKILAVCRQALIEQLQIWVLSD